MKLGLQEKGTNQTNQSAKALIHEDLASFHFRANSG